MTYETKQEWSKAAKAKLFRPHKIDYKKLLESRSLILKFL